MEDIKANSAIGKIKLVKQNIENIKLDEISQKEKKINENDKKIKLVINKNTNFMFHTKCLGNLNKEKINDIILNNKNTLN